MLKFKYKKLQLNFMSECQAMASVAEEDWLCILASTTDKEHGKMIRKEISHSIEFADTLYTDMLEDQIDYM